MKKNKKKEKNFLEFIPVKADTNKIDFEKNDKGLVKLIIWRNGWLDRLVRKFYKTPDKMVIDLDELGSCVWNSIDGNRNVHDISLIVKKQFGKKAEPLNERLITYMRILKNNNFIIFKEN